ncbi:flagellar motor switch protein FliN [Paramicrobacterium agarici]|uniref:Flagellar motor switch protein FliN/FliY n=1 Tax=Paramicrobacterium agarici TaxID=630514 RepID=A0A2A9DW52_9MICO|nr:flagellar motor switch protein FliN [Microbacterium agarici]PFG30596.1 flagellar motor switch protein FliN/FliY [Microbacterium agarici]TQO23614.1 flagellar motor switch protein FliN/FliY [Microbacterium agarici]
MTSTMTHESAIAAAFAAKLPTTEPVSARASDSSGDTGDAVIASFVGDASAHLAVQIIDDATFADGLADAPIADRIHDALRAAVSVLGAGVLDEPAPGDASAIFSSPQAQVFDLHDAAGATLGRIAVQITRTGTTAPSGRLRRIAGVEMDLTVEIGRARMPVRDVLDLEPGRIVELDRSAGAPADIKLNGRLIAHGEVVVVDQDYAVRITRILENTES